jgi:hypothetical protein
LKKKSETARNSPRSFSGRKWAKSLTSLKRLGLVGDQVTDDGLENLAGLTNLERLYLFKLKVSDAALRHLEGLANFRPPDIALLGYDRLAGLYSQAET